jgi:glycosyltransferase involved in cell wall biosynthesis
MTTKTKREVSLIVPVLNEEKTVRSILDRCFRQNFVKQIVIVNDGSTDSTKDILEKTKRLEKSKAVELVVVHHKVNLGKGSAIKTGLKHVSSKYVIVQDADLEYAPEDIKDLLREANNSEDQIIFGSRGHNKRKSYFLALLGNYYLSLMFNILFNYRLEDSYTCYKLIPRKIWKELNLKSTGFEIDSELIAKLGVKGYKIREVPISYKPRTYKEGKKIKWTDLLKASLVAFEIRMGIFPQNRGSS